MAAYSLPVPMVALVTSGGGWARGTSGSRQGETPAPWILRGQRVMAPQPVGLCRSPESPSASQNWAAPPLPTPPPPPPWVRGGRRDTKGGRSRRCTHGCAGGGVQPAWLLPVTPPARSQATLPASTYVTPGTQVTLRHPSTTVRTRLSLLRPHPARRVTPMAPGPRPGPTPSPGAGCSPGERPGRVCVSPPVTVLPLRGQSHPPHRKAQSPREREALGFGTEKSK